MAFYNNYVGMCNKVNKSPSAVAEEMGFQRSVITRWSKGTAPRQATLQKVADYFGCTLEDLTAEAEKPAPIVESELTEKQKAAIEFIRRLSDEQLSRFIKMGEAAFEDEN